MAGSVNKGVVLDHLMNVPLGAADGEANLQTPFNTSPNFAVIRVLNHSATVKRRVVKSAVSFRRGGTHVANEKQYRDAGYSAESIQRDAQHMDMNIYEDVVRPTKAVLTFDGRKYVIPPANAPGEEPAPVTVPEGCYDLYCGNYGRMTSPDPRERAIEMASLNNRFGGDHTLVMRFDANGENLNPFGILEFIREEVKPSSVAADKLLLAGNIEEV